MPNSVHSEIVQDNCGITGGRVPSSKLTQALNRIDQLERREVQASKECEGMHRFFVAHEGTLEGPVSVKIYAVVVCTACSESKLIEHVMLKDAAQKSN
jgi:hypothetical protein